MRRWLPLALALAGCLSSPPGSTQPPRDDAAPDPALRVLGVFERDAFTHDAVTDDLVTAVVYGERTYLLHLRAEEDGLAPLLDRADAVELPFRPVAMTGADANGDNAIDVIAAGADGSLAVLASTPDGLELIDQDVVVDSGNPLGDISTVAAPDLAGQERLFLFSPGGIWMSDPLDTTGVIHLDEINPRMTDVPLPAAFYASHDDVDTWYVGVAQGVAVDLWPLSGFDREVANDLIGYQAPDPPSIGSWRRLTGPLRVAFFGVLPASNRVAWVSRQLDGEETSAEIDLGQEGPLRGLTTVQQPEGYDLLTLSEDPDGRVGVQAAIAIGNPDDAAPIAVIFSQPTSVDTSLAIWLQPAVVTATPYAGKEILVFDEVGHVLCLEFDAGHSALASCGEADLRDHMPAWTGSG